jgi:IS30 family transposase
MEERRRRGLSGRERSELWRRWKRGQSLSDIGRALGKAPASVHGFLSAKGGIAPIARRRSDRALTVHEREEISRRVCAGESLRSVARLLGRSPSTVSREVARNGGRRRYRATDADGCAWARARRPKACKLALHSRLRGLVAEAWARLGRVFKKPKGQWRRAGSCPGSS